MTRNYTNSLKKNNLPTIRDVAKSAKVSTATVSLVIHNHKRISDETRVRVNRVIKELNYHPSHSARGLASQKTGNIGFVLTEDHFLRSEPFYTRIFLGTEFAAREKEFYVLLTTVPSNFQKEDRLPRFVLERNIDGIIVAGKVPKSIIESLDKYNLPIVCVDFYSDPNKYSVVLIDNVNGGYLATKHLIELNHRNIAFIGGDINHPSIRDRFVGYKMAMDEAEISVNNDLYIVDETEPTRENGYNAAKKLFAKNKRVTGIFSCNDAMAIGVIQYLKENKIRIPEDVSIIGFDDVEADLSLDPPLSSIKVSKIDLGIEAVHLMYEILNDNIKKIKKVLVPVELVQRSSTKMIQINS